MVGTGADPALGVTMPGILLAKGVLDQEQYARANRYRYLRCALYGPPWPSNAQLGVGIPDDAAIRKLQAKFNAIVRRLEPEERRVVSSVCVFDQAPKPIEINLLKGALAEMG